MSTGKRSFAALNKDKRPQNKPKKPIQEDSDEELMPRALPVEGDPAVVGSKPHENANEYLLQVRMEASRYGDNFVATNFENTQQLPVNHNYGPTSFLFQYFNPESTKKSALFTEITEEWKKGVIQAFIKTKEVIYLLHVIET